MQVGYDVFTVERRDIYMILWMRKMVLVFGFIALKITKKMEEENVLYLIVR